MFQNDDRVQTRRRQADTAIRLAMANRWEEAVNANKSILTLFPNDADSYNRLGKALMELGRYSEAKKSYKKAVDLEPTNQIARKNLERLGVLIKSGAGQASTTLVDPSLFIEEMGKTAVTTLQEVSKDVLNTLDAGEGVDLLREGKVIRVATPGGDIVGTIEPKLTLRLNKLLDGGNEYAVAITSLAGGECKIIIRETYQHPSQVGRPSFPAAGTTETLRPYTKERLLRVQAGTEERGEREEDSGLDDEEGDESWDGDRVVQEGHVRLNDAAAAEDVDDEIEE